MTFHSLRHRAGGRRDHTHTSALRRSVGLEALDLDERMHTTPWFHATNIPNAPATNLVQIGIGGWQAPRAAVKVDRPAAPP